MRKRVTIADVAQAAGVSTATVSYVINEDPKQPISPETRRRVLQAVKDLHYHRNDAARALRSSKTNSIGVAINHPLNTQSYSTAFQSVLNALKPQGKYAYLDMGTPGNDAVRTCIDFYLSGKVDGILILGEARDTLEAEYEDAIVSMNIPCVVQNMDAGNNISSVNIDFFAGAYAITKRLIAEGAKRVLYFRTEHSTRIDRERQQAISRAAYESGVPSDVIVASEARYQFDENQDFPGTNVWQLGYLQMCRAIDSLGPDDALIIGWCDHLDYVMAAERESSKRPYIGVLTHLTDTLRTDSRIFYDCVSAASIGRESVGLLLEQLEGSAPPRHILLHSEIH